MGQGHTATRLREEAAQFRKLGAISAAIPEEVKARRQAAEEAYSNVVSRLGAAGTYGPGAPAATSETPAEGIFKQVNIESPLQGANYGEGAIYDTKGAKNYLEKKGYLPSGAIGKTTIKANVLDQEKFQKQVEQSAQFRIASQLTAEAEQLINREGPLYNEMVNNLQLPIMEGSAALARQNTEEIRRAMQRGGSARRSAFEAVQKIRSQERINSQKIQQLAQVRSSLDTWSRENARTVLDFGQNWASNLGGIRESYQNALDAAADMMLTKAMPLVFNAEQNASNAERAAEEVRAQMHAENREKAGKMYMGIAAVAAIAMGGVGFLGMIGAGAGAAGAAGGAAGAGAVGASASTAGMAAAGPIGGAASWLGQSALGGVAAAAPTAGMAAAGPIGGAASWLGQSALGGVAAAAPTAASTAGGLFSTAASTLAPYTGSLLSTGIRLGTSALGQSGVATRRRILLEE